MLYGLLFVFYVVFCISSTLFAIYIYKCTEKYIVRKFFFPEVKREMSEQSGELKISFRYISVEWFLV